MARRHWLPTLVHKRRGSKTTPEGDPKHKNRKLHEKYDLQMLQQQQHRHQRRSNYRYKIRFMDSKKLQGPDSKQQNEQHHGQRPTGKTGNYTQRHKKHR